MKAKLITLLVVAAGIPAATATTITASGGTTGAQFVTSLGTFLTPTNAVVEVGRVFEGSFIGFATTDATPISFGTTASLTGRWLGNAADTGNTANAFNSQQIWFRITTTADGGGVGVFGSTLNFPINGGGAADTLNVPASSLTTIGSASSVGTVGFTAAGGSFPNGSVTIGVIPEPSAVMLGALGALGLLRRRRN